MSWLLLIAVLCLASEDNDEALVARHAASAAQAMQTGDYITAEKHHRIVVRLRPALAEAQFNLGLSLFLQTKYEEAIGAFREALKMKPDLVNASLFAGISLFNLNRSRDALPALTEYTAAQPEDLQGQYFLGLCYLALERFGEATKALTSARTIDPHNTDVLYHLAQSYLGQARKQPSKINSLAPLYEEVVKQIAAFNPGSFRLAQLRAGYYEATGKKAEAIRELELLLENDPKVRGLHYTLGCLYMEAGQYEKSRQQFEAEMKLDAPYPRTYFQLGHVHLALEGPAQALALLHQALERDPDSAGPVWVDIGRAHRALGQPDKAAPAFEKAISLGERSSSTYYQLGMTLKSTGDLEGSRNALETSRRLRSEEQAKNLASP
jgi:tetratricopeptide (TPR) repeat protein